MTTGNPFSFLFRRPTPDLFFTAIPINKTKEYVVTLLDLNNPEMSSYNSKQEYAVWKTKLVKGFEELNIDPELTYKLHFPIKSFQIAWELCRPYKILNPEVTIDCNICFRRETKKKLVILNKNFLNELKTVENSL